MDLYVLLDVLLLWWNVDRGNSRRWKYLGGKRKWSFGKRATQAAKVDIRDLSKTVSLVETETLT